MSQRRILHIDINSYFATMLQQKYPDLRGVPLGVVKDKGRTCIIAASKEAKKFGVKTGSNVKEARKLCPKIKLVPAEFDYYLESTKKLKKIFGDLSPDVCIYSLDEAFVEVTGMSFIYPSVHQLAGETQEEIKEELGEWVTCNIGISYTPFLAKMAQEISPKGSITEVTPEETGEFLSKVKIEDVWGIGRALNRGLKELGVETVGELAELSDRFLFRHFGKVWGKALKLIGTGEGYMDPLREDQPGPFRASGGHPKSVSRSITGFKLCDSEWDIKRILYNLCAEVGHKARKQGLAGRKVSVSLTGSKSSVVPRSGSGRNDTRTPHWKAHRTLKRHLYHTDELFDIVYHTLYKNWERDFKVIRFRICLSLIEPLDQLPLNLLPRDRRRDELQEAIDELNEKYGLFTVRSGLLTDPEVIIKPEVTGYFADQDYHFGGK